MLKVLSIDDAKILYRYTDQAEDAFRTLLQRVFQAVETGAFTPQSVEMFLLFEDT